VVKLVKGTMMMTKMLTKTGISFAACESCGHARWDILHVVVESLMFRIAFLLPKSSLSLCRSLDHKYWVCSPSFTLSLVYWFASSSFVLL
jgi:hypothetical protein